MSVILGADHVGREVPPATVDDPGGPRRPWGSSARRGGYRAGGTGGRGSWKAIVNYRGARRAYARQALSVAVGRVADGVLVPFGEGELLAPTDDEEICSSSDRRRRMADGGCAGGR